MPTRPFDDLPQPYGPGWFEAWPGEQARTGGVAHGAGSIAPPIAATTTAASVAPTPPEPPVARRFVRTLGEYMQAVRAAVPYLGEPTDGPCTTSHDAAARTLIGRLVKAGSRHASASPQDARASVESAHTH